MNIKNKKGVSVIIGYVVLVTFGIILSVIVYNYLKTYVPAEEIDCPSGVSIFLKNYDYNCESHTLTLYLKNNGKFNSYGYFIHASNDSRYDLATIDLSKDYISGNPRGLVSGSVVYFNEEATEPLIPNSESQSTFNIDEELNDLVSIEITPIRFQDEDYTQRFVACGNAKITEKIFCS